MCLMRTCFFIILFLCLFTHACNARPISAATSSTSQNKFQPQKENLKFSMRIRAEVRVVPRKSADIFEENKDVCRKISGSNKGTKSGSEDCQSSLQKALPYPTKSELVDVKEGCKKRYSEGVSNIYHLIYHRLTDMHEQGSMVAWPHLNVKEMDLDSSIFRDEDLSETDYQPPHRKSPIHN